MAYLKRRSSYCLLALKQAWPGCRTARRAVSQPRRRDESRVDCGRQPGMRGAQPFRAPQPRRISLLVCNGRLPARGEGQRDGDVPSLRHRVFLREICAVEFATISASLAKGLNN